MRLSSKERIEIACLVTNIESRLWDLWDLRRDYFSSASVAATMLVNAMMYPTAANKRLIHKWVETLATVPAAGFREYSTLGSVMVAIDRIERLLRFEPCARNLDITEIEGSGSRVDEIYGRAEIEFKEAMRPQSVGNRIEEPIDMSAPVSEGPTAPTPPEILELMR